MISSKENLPELFYLLNLSELFILRRYRLEIVYSSCQFSLDSQVFHVKVFMKVSSLDTIFPRILMRFVLIALIVIKSSNQICEKILWRLSIQRRFHGSIFCRSVLQADPLKNFQYSSFSLFVWDLILIQSINYFTTPWYMST